MQISKFKEKILRRENESSPKRNKHFLFVVLFQNLFIWWTEPQQGRMGYLGHRRCRRHGQAHLFRPRSHDPPEDGSQCHTGSQSSSWVWCIPRQDWHWLVGAVASRDNKILHYDLQVPDKHSRGSRRINQFRGRPRWYHNHKNKHNHHHQDRPQEPDQDCAFMLYQGFYLRELIFDTW